ncbi:MAG: fructose-bisphosphate aldolase class I [Candidatus Pedobacter colombiensis]|uniref:Fructose-bisphosphate aldolase n=1 Tax=Candidatus Pedobacter colombiensis TaxID=3121371 RepID=A0AAJ6B9M2_9SPHI|nr:class I fructose-bisphosphate aldolase [Pedobacter sp.]WEK20343.1 MAG: fructose-bisphosphate aldolase class I [Pedobacter sp.]
MYELELKNIVQRLMTGDKGLLAMDESLGTCNKRFKALGIPQTEEFRRKYRELIVTTPHLEESISGAILFEETIYQKTEKGTSFLEILEHKGITPGIKVDQGTVALPAFPDEKITEGLDGMRERLVTYAKLGLRFAKFRAVITIGDGIPTKTCIKANAFTLGKYAALCQEAGIVPIVEPEVLMDGDHTLQQCAEVTRDVLHAVFNELYHQRVLLEGMILKPNMILPGLNCSDQRNIEEIASETITSFLKVVPAAVGGVAFLSGGQSYQLASERLNMMQLRYGQMMPWPLTFSFSRAIQQPALEIWKGDEKNLETAQKMLRLRAACNSAARRAEYSSTMEVKINR